MKRAGQSSKRKDYRLTREDLGELGRCVIWEFIKRHDWILEQEEKEQTQMKAFLENFMIMLYMNLEVNGALNIGDVVPPKPPSRHRH